MGEARGQTCGDRRVQPGAHDRHRPRQLLYIDGRKNGGDDDSAWVASQQLSRKRRKAAGVAVRPAGLEHVILALREADLAHASVEHGHQLLAGACVSRAAAEDRDHWFCLLRPRGK